MSATSSPAIPGIVFTDAAARKEMFEEFDADLRAFLDSTRPRSWQTEEEA